MKKLALTQMSNAGIPLRVIQENSGHRTLDELQKYLEVTDAQVRGAVSSLSMISHLGKSAYPEVGNPYEAISVRRFQSKKTS